MELIILHHHFRPGGVRRVIELATPHLLAHGPGPARRLVLATSEAPPENWLAKLVKNLPVTAIEIIVEPAFGYASECGWPASQLRREARAAVGRLFAALPMGSVIWAHNLGLGRNLPLASELVAACQKHGVPLVAHHHDWWFDNRWHHYPTMRQQGFRSLPAIAGAVFANASAIRHAAINSADARVLEKHLGSRAGWLPNLSKPAPPVSSSRRRKARAWLDSQTCPGAPIWLLPGRLLRRKNIAEALLITRWLRPDAWLVTTAGPSSAEEQAYARRLDEAARAHRWPLRLGVLRQDEAQKPGVPDLLAASEAILLTSLQEGFGLPYLEAAAAQRPLIARALPNIAPDLHAFGFRFPQAYAEILVAPSLFDWTAEAARQGQLFRQWKKGLPAAAARMLRTARPPVCGPRPHPAPFSRLTLTAQLEVLAQPLEYSWRQCAPWNPQLSRWRKLAAQSQLKTSRWPRSAARWLSGAAYARRFWEMVPGPFAKSPARDTAAATQTEFLRQKLRADNFYPLLWNLD